MRRRFALLALLSLAACSPSGPITAAKTPAMDMELLDTEIALIAERAQPAMMEVAVRNLEGGDYWAWNGENAFPMQSVFKAPLGAAVLADVDAGKLSLDQRVTIAEEDLSPPHSPIADAWPAVATYSLRDLLVRAVGDSDNTAADVLMRLIGGPGGVTAWLQSERIKGLRIDRYERELQPDIYGMASFRLAWKGGRAFSAARDSLSPAIRRTATARYLADPRDTATASGALTFLGDLSRGELLSPANTALLLKIMTETPTGQNRLKAGLPPGAVLAHKTGTSGTDLGMTPVVNDIGVVTLKDGRQYAVAVFLTGSRQDEVARDRIFADVMRVIVRAVG